MEEVNFPWTLKGSAQCGVQSMTLEESALGEDLMGSVGGLPYRPGVRKQGGEKLKANFYQNLSEGQL